MSDIGGYEYTFVDTPTDRLVCIICNYPSRDPYMTACCGHTFCKSCLDNVKRYTSITSACPMCRDETFPIFPNKQADREVKGLRVICTNQGRGCEWQGELNYISDHLQNSCNFEDVSCFNECGIVVQRQHVFMHVESECPCRQQDCQYCQITGEHWFIEGDHRKNCTKLPLPCPNKCEMDSVPREDMEAHRKECPLEVIQCEYHNMGCEERMMRKNKRKHEEEHMEEHLLMTKAKLSKTENTLASTESRLDCLEEMVHYLIGENATSKDKMIISACSSVHITSLSMTCPVIVRMSKYTEYKEEGDNWYSDSFYSHTRGYKMCLVVDAEGHDNAKYTHMSVFLFLEKGQYDDELSWPMRGKFEVKLLNQISDTEHHTCSVTYRDHMSCKIADTPDRVPDESRLGNGRSRFISNKKLCKITPTRQFIKDNCVYFQISML
ncbi:TNF receptor-associated factor 4-like isoform X1 [Dysidea avara]|uniref:TNF receptor-associated factor 4-like isoform X1 n=1 Tax=Dysidea avara TaxID=196820 RepID=UPI003322F68C